MKKFKDCTRTEKGMIIVLILLLLAIFVNWSRVSSGVVKGFDIFFSSPKSVQQADK